MLIAKIKFLEYFLNENLPKKEYLIVNSSWLSMMNIRVNGDLDILISNNLWDKKFYKFPKTNSFGLTDNFNKRIRVHSIINGPYSKLLKYSSNDEIIKKYRVYIDGIPFILPRLYFTYKVLRLKKINKAINELTLLKKLNMFDHNRNKLFLKKKKDEEDFKKMRLFFIKENHKSFEWSSLSLYDWGLDKKNLKKILV